MSSQGKMAVIGGGVAGITSAFLLQEKYYVTIYEKNNYLGGHTNTYVVDKGPDAGTAIDTGFIVLNDKTYPNFHKLLRRLGVPVRYADMSFGFSCEESGLQYSGRGLAGLFAQRMNLFSPSYIKFILGIRRFCINAANDLATGNLSPEIKLSEYAAKYAYSRALIHDYIVPMGAAIWSAPVNSMLEFPAITFLNFFRNHGLLSLKDRPRWQTVVGGSHSYVKAFQRSFKGNICINTTVKAVRREAGKVIVELNDGSREEFDLLIMASHADQAYNLVQDKTEKEKELLGVWKYQKNMTVLHTDESVLNICPAAQASWNYHRKTGSSPGAPLSVTYDMNRLQGLKTKNRYFVTLNATNYNKNSVLMSIEYEHPVYTKDAINSQGSLASINGENSTWYCGSYFNYGFHEDAVTSAVNVAESHGVKL